MKESIEHMNGDIDQSKLDRLTMLDKLLNEKLVLVKKLDDEILEECDIKDIEKDIEESEEITSRVYEIKNKIKKLCAKEHQGDQVQSIPEAHKNMTISEPLNSQPTLVEISTESVSGHLNQESYQVSMAQFVPKIRLPKLSLLKFNGEITKFRTFWDSFRSAVDNNPNLTPIDKFNYLYSLLEGSGLQAIQGLTITDENYKSAVEILHNRFGKTQQVIAAHMDKLLKLPSCSGGTSSSLRLIYNKVGVNVRGLEVIVVMAEQYGSLLIPVIMSKLPSDVRIQIARNTTKDVRDIRELLDVIQKEVEARKVCENIKTHSDYQNKKSNAPVPRGLGLASALLASGSGVTNQFSIRCAFCQKPHYSASCEDVCDVNKKKKFLNEMVAVLSACVRDT
jgi:hypothetical protein